MIKTILKPLILMLSLSCMAFSCNETDDDGQAEKETTPKGDETSSKDDDTTSDGNVIVINGHRFVDLGLPSGLLWAETNVGAENPEDAGDFFSWGETSPKVIYDSTTDKYCSCPDGKSNCVDASHYTKYNSTDGKTVLDPEDDAATVNWGSISRMPTKEEFQELLDKCTWIWDSSPSHKGYLVASSNGKSIFLPASGSRNGSDLYGRGTYGYYWSSTLNSSHRDGACSLYVGRGPHGIHGNDFRYYGSPVRPVAEP